MKTTLLALLFIFFISCSDDEQPAGEQPIDERSESCETRNDQEIQDYLAENNLEAEKSESGLYYIIDEEGTGVQPTATDDVRVAYTGYYTDGEIFDQSPAEGISFNLEGVIEGWTEGITYFKEGGSGMLLVPSDLGYGAEDYRGIPGCSVLIFDIELLDVEEDAS